MSENFDTIISFSEAAIFQKESLILSHVSFTIHKGEFVYLVGRVGSGKSSLIKTMNAELPLQVGTARVAGYDIQSIKRKQVPYLRRKVGVVFQDFKLLQDRNIHENLRFVMRATGWTNKKEIESRIGDVLEKVGLEYKGYKMPHQLSGGEQQRVVIARALLNEPQILLADEPTGNLDPETSESIMGILHDISKNGCAVLMATHNYNLVERHEARILKCEGDKLIEVDYESFKKEVKALMA